MSQLPTYILERVFDAPRPLVWKAWTDPQLLSRWYGPNVETVIHKLDVTQGGLWLNEMKMGQNSGYQKTEFTEVLEPEKLVCLMSNADADWNITANPMMPDWPKTLLTVVSFQEVGKNRTALRLEWTPHDASPAEIACFENAMENMGKGWGAGMEHLARVLAELADA